MIELHLPFPDSTNTHWRHVLVGGKPRVLLSAAGRKYRGAVLLALVTQQWERQHGRLAVEIDLYAPNNRDYDTDNRIKPLLDALTHGGCWQDDGQVDHVEATRMPPEAPGKCIVRISPWPAPKPPRAVLDAQEEVFLALVRGWLGTAPVPYPLNTDDIRRLVNGIDARDSILADLLRDHGAYPQDALPPAQARARADRLADYVRGALNLLDGDDFSAIEQATGLLRLALKEEACHAP